MTSPIPASLVSFESTLLEAKYYIKAKYITKNTKTVFHLHSRQ